MKYVNPLYSSVTEHIVQKPFTAFYASKHPKKKKKMALRAGQSRTYLSVLVCLNVSSSDAHSIPSEICLTGHADEEMVAQRGHVGRPEGNHW